MKQVTMAAMAIAASCVLCMTYCAFADTPRTHERVIFASVGDTLAQAPDGGSKAEVGAEAQHEPMLEVTVESDGGLPDIGVELVDVADYEPYAGPSEVQGNPDGLNSFVGVVEYGDHVETYYATSAVYDDQLSVDEQGFYRDSEGRYVVASSDHEIGEVIETSQGEAIVMDDGTAPGVVDMHVNWR